MLYEVNLGDIIIEMLEMGSCRAAVWPATLTKLPPNNTI